MKLISDKMSAIPYELNHRMNYSCQISESFGISYFSGRHKNDNKQNKDLDFIKKHLDSCFDK